MPAALRFALPLVLFTIPIGTAMRGGSARAQTPQQPAASSGNAAGSAHAGEVTLLVRDENGVAVPDAEVTVLQAGRPPHTLRSDDAGRCLFLLTAEAPYTVRIRKPGFYLNESAPLDPAAPRVEVTLPHEQDLAQQVTVSANSSGIDPERTSDVRSFSTAEIVNIPYPTSRDIRNLLAFTPNVLQDSNGQIHVAGAESYETLDLLDGFDIRSPISGTLSLRLSADAVRSLQTQTTRYPAEFGRASGGVVAFETGMGNNKFRFNATNFIPSFRLANGVRFDKFVPRVTFSGPILRNRAWFFDGFEAEADNIYVTQLPANANTNFLLRGSNLLKFQVNATPANIITAGFLLNEYHSDYDGLSPLRPQASTAKRDDTADLIYLRDQHSFRSGELLDVGGAFIHFRTGYEPQGTTPFAITPEGQTGSYFENLTSHSHRDEATATLFFGPRHQAGRHDAKIGLVFFHTGIDESLLRTPIRYERQNGTVERLSTFPAARPFTIHNLETGAFAQDRWTAPHGFLLEPGLRFDWDEIIRRPRLSPRFAMSWAPRTAEPRTKLSAGAGLYFEHTQLEYLARSGAGQRNDTFYASDGVTALTPPLLTTFESQPSHLRETRALNWSVGLEERLPYSVLLSANFMQRRLVDGFIYSQVSTTPAAGPTPAPPESFAGTYVLTNDRKDHYTSFEVDARRAFRGGYTLFAAYTRSSATTTTALDYRPTLTQLGPQQPGPLPWNAPNRFLSWGWMPIPFRPFRPNWDLVYTFQYRTGFPWTAIDSNQDVIGKPGAQTFPNVLVFSPGLEWRFHVRRYYLGLRAVLENATASSNPINVYNNVESPQFGQFSNNQGRAVTARIRLIETK